MSINSVALSCLHILYLSVLYSCMTEIASAEQRISLAYQSNEKIIKERKKKKKKEQEQWNP